jgi:heme/copper-type cytochrome/quinol oxidase subunit 2
VELYLHSPITPSWRGAQSKHKDNLNIIIIIIIIIIIVVVIIIIIIIIIINNLLGISDGLFVCALIEM